MPKYSANALLISRLVDILELSGTAIANRCGIWPATLNRYISGSQHIPIDILLQVCNKIRIPVWYFVNIDNTSLIPTREQMTLPSGIFKEVWWDFDEVERSFGDHTGQIRWTEVAEAMGVNPNKPHAWFQLKVRFTLQRFLEVCTAIQFDPFRLLIDPNRPAARAIRNPGPPQPVVTSDREGDIISLQAQISGLQKEVIDLRVSLNKILAALPTLLHPAIVYDLPAEIPMAADGEKDEN